jgi:hypothetical protein
MGWTKLPLCVLVATLASGCLDIRSFEGTWSGPRVGDDPTLNMGFGESSGATLVIDEIDSLNLRATLTTQGDEFTGAAIRPIPAVEADALGGLSFDGSPERVFMSFAEPNDGLADAIAVIAIYNDDRVEVRIMRGNPAPLYGVFTLERTP